jgi:MFS family permease
MDLRGYGIIVAAVFTVSIAYAVRYGYGMLLPEMIASLPMTKTEAGLISAAYFGTYTIFSPVLGLLSDRCNARLLLTFFPVLLATTNQFSSSEKIFACFIPQKGVLKRVPLSGFKEVPLGIGALGSITFDLQFLSGLVSIVLIDLILAGDNAVVIAMAVRSLPPKQRKKGIIFGAGAPHGNLFLLLFGLSLSIPFVVFTSNLPSILMDKYPVIIYIGGAILGKVGGEMLITDPFTVNLIHPSRMTQYGGEAIFALGVVAVGSYSLQSVFVESVRRLSTTLDSGHVVTV